MSTNGPEARELEGSREPDRTAATAPAEMLDAEGGGDPVCWLPLVCPQCGELDGHRPGCRVAAEAAGDEGSAGTVEQG
jgi:hypothetical protein